MKRSNCVLCSNPHNNWWGFSMWLLGLIQWVTCSETNMTFKSRLYPGLTGKRPSAPAAAEAGLRSFLIRASSNPPSDLNLESRLVNKGQHLSKVGVVRRVRGRCISAERDKPLKNKRLWRIFAFAHMHKRMNALRLCHLLWAVINSLR